MVRHTRIEREMSGKFERGQGADLGLYSAVVATKLIPPDGLSLGSWKSVHYLSDISRIDERVSESHQSILCCSGNC